MNENKNNDGKITEQVMEKDNSAEIKALNKKIGGLKQDIVKLGCDVPVSYFYINDKFSHIMWIGLSGTISSSIGVYQMW